MAEIAAGFLGPAIEVVKLVAKRITRQFSYLCCFTRNIDNLKIEDEKLDDEMQELKSKVEIATNNAQDIVPAVTTWLRNSDHIKAEITGILSEAENVGTGCSKLGARFSLSKRSKKTTDRSTEHRGQKSFDSISQAGPPAAAQTVPGGTKLDFESRKKIEEAIMTTLRGGVVNLIGIYGMGGLGKTTMAQKLRNRVLNENVFQEVAMTVVSQQAETSKIQVEIGGQLGLEYRRKESSQARAQKLHARLSGTKWCTILITSRNEDALSKVGCKVENKFGMKILSEEEAWCLFRKGAGTCVDDTNLNSIAKEVVKECKGLPIALKTLGLALKDKNNASIWNNALRELKQCDADISNYVKKVYSPLILSYDFLDSEMAKSLFLLCCLFPEDSDIPLEKLTYFCMGLGIFEGITNVEDARNKMCSLIDTLKSQSLLLDSDKEDHARMHDVVRDVCIYLAKQKGCIGGNKCTWISSSQRFGERTELLTDSRFPNLRFLSLRGEREELEFGSAFLEGIKDLYVLCIESNWRLTSLPHTTQSVMNLKTLLFHSCRKLKSLSVVGKLTNLEILICRKCKSIEELPLEMKGLKRLKLLQLTGCYKLQTISRGIISSLVGLEELKMSGSFKRWEAEDRGERENAALTELEALTNLTWLEIEIDDPALAAENMHLSSKLKKFDIKFGVEDVVSSAVKSLCKKMYLRSEGQSCLGDRIETQLLRDTEGLYLRGDGANNVDLGKCQIIQSLELMNCNTMKSIWDGPISACSFQKLSFIQIGECHRLRNLGQLSIAGKDCLPQLETLCISNCSMMEQVFLWNNMEEAIESHVITKLFPNLKEVELNTLPNLTTFYQGIEGIEFPLQMTMKIEECPKMKSIIKASNEKSNSGDITSTSEDQHIDDHGHSFHLLCQSGKVSFYLLLIAVLA